MLHSLEVLLKPLQRHQKGALLRENLFPVVEVPSDGEAVLDAYSANQHLTLPSSSSANLNKGREAVCPCFHSTGQAGGKEPNKCEECT